MKSKPVTLSSGEQVRVCAVAPYAVMAAQNTVPLPQLPRIKQRVVTPGGEHEEELPAPEDSDESRAYYEARRAAEDRRAEIAGEVTLLLGLPDVQAPADDTWLVTLEHYGVKRREGPEGRRLDYIMYALLASEHDLTAVYGAIEELSYRPATEAGIRAKADSFQRDSGRNGTGGGAGGETPARAEERKPARVGRRR